MARYVIKLGSGITASDDGSLRAEVLEAICEEVAARRRAGDDVVVVSSGAIVRGLDTMGIPGRPSAIDDLQAASAIGQGRLFRFYDELLAARGVTAAQVLLTFFDLSHRTHYLNARQALRRLLDWGVVPIVNENDTTATDEITFGDNDFLAALVAALLKARLLVLLTNTDGVFTGDPRTSPDAELLSSIEDTGVLETIQIGESSTLGRGGMRSKITSARIASESGVPVVICNGTRADELSAAAAGGEVGTRFTAARVERRLSPYKLWLKYAKQPTGSVVVDPGAAVRLRESGSSLLAVGVTGAVGAFAAGDAVWVSERGVDKPLGKGISEYSAGDIERTAGHRSSYLREHFPDVPDEVIHRDRFVLV
jgi:glutamate 5-kinase